MSNLSQFFGGGGPTTISKATTSYSYSLSAGDEQTASEPDIDTGIFANPADRAYITQGQSGNMGWYFDQAQSSYGYMAPVCSAFLGSGGQVKIALGGITYRTSTGGRTAIFSGNVMWWLIQYD